MTMAATAVGFSALAAGWPAASDAVNEIRGALDALRQASGAMHA